LCPSKSSGEIWPILIYSTTPHQFGWHKWGSSGRNIIYPIIISRLHYLYALFPQLWKTSFEMCAKMLIPICSRPYLPFRQYSPPSANNDQANCIRHQVRYCPAVQPLTVLKVSANEVRESAASLAMDSSVHS